MKQKTKDPVNHKRTRSVYRSINLNPKDMDTKKKVSSKKGRVQLKIESKKQEVLPGQQIAVYSKVTKKEVQEVVKELNPDLNSLGSRG